MTEHVHWSNLNPDNLEAWAGLIHHLATVDRTEEFYSAEDLAEELQAQAVELEQDTWSVWAQDRLIGYGFLRTASHPDVQGVFTCTLEGGVHADFRGRGFGRELMDRLEARAVSAMHERHPGERAQWRVNAGLPGSAAQAMLERRGYQPVRYFNLLALELPAERIPVLEPSGVHLRAPREDDEAAMLTAHRMAFADHWGSAPHSRQSWHEYWTAASNRWQDSTVAVDDDGVVLGYALAGQWVDRELYVNIVGTIPSARGRGIARAALARTIAVAGERGAYDVIELDVDSASPTGATALYEGLGFRPKHTTVTMQRDADTGRSVPAGETS